MIRMVQSSSASQAKAYFTDSLQKADYYINDQELQGTFHGKLAARLNLSTNATKDEFFALCENINPATGKTLTPRTRGDRTTGYDINFHAPKSVSILHALSKDEHILKAFEHCVQETMKEIEADAKTRVRKYGAYDERPTSELVWASFTHQTARPVDGHLPDPHLHCHNYLINATWDDTEKQIKAGHFRDINASMPYYQARFQKRFADSLTDLGYGIKRTSNAFEIKNVPQAAIDLFSKRTNAIGQVAKEKGITDAKKLSELGAKTRAKKQKGLSMDELRTGWRNQVKDHITYKDGEEDKLIRHAPAKEHDNTIDADCVDFAIRHSFERASVKAERRILETAYRQSIGKRSITLDGITENFNKDSRIIRVKEKYKTLCTTKAVLAEEREMVELARQGQNSFQPLYKTSPALDPKLNDQQAAAIEHVLTTTHQVSIVRGAAGTGKTTIMSEVDKHLKTIGKEMFVVAPTAQASRGVLVQEGFENAQTVARLILDKDLQAIPKGKVLWIDEAGLLGTADMKAVLEVARQQNCRVILGGDTKQHSSVQRGDALRILNTVGGLKAAEVTKIHRQKDVHYRAAVEDLSKGDVSGAFIKLTSIGAIKQVDPLKPNETLINEYVNAVKKGKSALIVSPTHAQGNAVTAEVRDRLKAVGKLGKKEANVRKLENLNLTEAQKSDWRNFTPGQQIQFNQNLPRIKRGSQWIVQDASSSAIRIANGDKEEYLPLLRAKSFDVYNQTDIALAKGDKIRITHNSFDKDKKRVDNGDAFEIIKVSKDGELVLANKAKTRYTLDKNYGHITHDYCTTSHSSQGKTVDEVFISQPASTFTATNAKQFYVSVSRGKDAAHIYTDDRKALLEHASEIGDRQSAIELVGDEYSHIDYIHHQHKEAYQKSNAEQTKQDITRPAREKGLNYER